MKHKRALSVAAAAAAVLALSAMRFSPADAVPITGLVAACSGLLALARRRRRTWRPHEWHVPAPSSTWCVGWPPCCLMCMGPWKRRRHLPHPSLLPPPPAEKATTREDEAGQPRACDDREPC